MPPRNGVPRRRGVHRPPRDHVGERSTQRTPACTADDCPVSASRRLNGRTFQVHSGLSSAVSCGRSHEGAHQRQAPELRSAARAQVSVRPSEPVEGEIDVAGDPGVIMLMNQVEQVVDQLHVATVSTRGRGRVPPRSSMPRWARLSYTAIRCGAGATSTAEARASPVLNPGSELNSRRPKNAAAGVDTCSSQTASTAHAMVMRTKRSGRLISWRVRRVSARIRFHFGAHNVGLTPRPHAFDHRQHRLPVRREPVDHRCRNRSGLLRSTSPSTFSSRNCSPIAAAIGQPGNGSSGRGHPQVLSRPQPHSAPTVRP